MIPECHSAGSQLKPTANGNQLFCHCCTTAYLLHYPQSEHLYYQHNSAINTKTLSTQQHYQHKNTINTTALSTQQHYQHKNTINTTALSTQKHYQHNSTINTTALSTQQHYQHYQHNSTINTTALSTQQHFQHNKAAKGEAIFLACLQNLFKKISNYGTHLILKDDSVATISVAPIHFLVLTILPPNCAQPWGSNPFCHAFSVSCCSF